MILLLSTMALADTIPIVQLGPYLTMLPPVEAALLEYYEGECPPDITMPLEEVYGLSQKIKTIHDPALGRVTACVCPPGCNQDDCGFEVTTSALFAASFECAGSCAVPAVPESPADPQDFSQEEEEEKEEDEPPTCPAEQSCEQETMRVSSPDYHRWIMEALK